jgi:hypothetical protein
MAVSKAIRSNPPVQPQPQHAKTARAGGPESKRRRHNPQLKAELFDTLRDLNRGYGIARSALYRLHHKDRRAIFPAACLRELHNRTEALRALANRDLLRFVTGREERDASRFSRLCSNRR